MVTVLGNGSGRAEKLGVEEFQKIEPEISMSICYGVWRHQASREHESHQRCTNGP